MEMPQIMMMQQLTKKTDEPILLNAFVRREIFFKKFSRHGCVFSKYYALYGVLKISFVSCQQLMSGISRYIAAKRCEK